MEVDAPDDVAGFKEHFNGAVPIKRARMDLTTTSSDAAQLRKRKEAEKAYGRGRKIPGEYTNLIFPASSDIDGLQ
jgi:U3 small nucleolar RNA-associated protein 7